MKKVSSSNDRRALTQQGEKEVVPRSVAEELANDEQGEVAAKRLL
jgi:hypothetical protein